MDYIYILVGLLPGAVIGGVATSVSLKNKLSKKQKHTLEEAKQEAEVIKKEKILQAKERFLSLKEEHEKVILQRERKLTETERSIKQKSDSLSNQIEQNKRETHTNRKNRETLNAQIEAIEKKQNELTKLNQEKAKELEKIAGIDKDDAKKQLMEVLKSEARTDAMVTIKSIIDEAKLNANKEAKKIIIQTIQRVASEQAIENSVSSFNIPNDEVKGKIIGREGRNIRALEAATGVEIIVDDTPEAILLSCFDPVRREIARLSLHQLVSDGRIHPARIEEIVKKTKKNIEGEIIEIGQRTCIDLDIHGLNPELVRMVGRMKYRSSYGQNLLRHSREVANMAATLASELGLNPKIAKRAGLLHDIGKVIDEAPELPHAIAGMKMAEKFKENLEICNAIGAHHDEIEMTSMISPIIQICDSVSGARPGARREVMEAYVNRLKELESIGLSYPNVNEVFAIQAGRELRVMVDSEKISDTEADQISIDLAKKIEEEMTYPGQVKVTVIKERRSVNYAK